MAQATWNKLMKPILPTENLFLISDLLWVYLYLTNKILSTLTAVVHPKEVLGFINSLDESEISVAKLYKSIILKPFLTMIWIKNE